MSSVQQEDWLSFRERVAMQYEDLLFLRELENEAMALEDVVELSRMHWDSSDDEDNQFNLSLLRRIWDYLGGGTVIAHPLTIVNAPRTPLRSRKRRMIDLSD